MECKFAPFVFYNPIAGVLTLYSLSGLMWNNFALNSLIGFQRKLALSTTCFNTLNGNFCCVCWEGRLEDDVPTLHVSVSGRSGQNCSFPMSSLPSQISVQNLPGSGKSWKKVRPGCVGNVSIRDATKRIIPPPGHKCGEVLKRKVVGRVVTVFKIEARIVVFGHCTWRLKLYVCFFLVESCNFSTNLKPTLILPIHLWDTQLLPSPHKTQDFSLLFWRGTVAPQPSPTPVSWEEKNFTKCSLSSATVSGSTMLRENKNTAIHSEGHMDTLGSIPRKMLMS